MKLLYGCNRTNQKMQAPKKEMPYFCYPHMPDLPLNQNKDV